MTPLEYVALEAWAVLSLVLGLLVGAIIHFGEQCDEPRPAVIAAARRHKRPADHE